MVSMILLLAGPGDFLLAMHMILQNQSPFHNILARWSGFLLLILIIPMYLSSASPREKSALHDQSASSSGKY